jgi:hypothetical protein
LKVIVLLWRWWSTRNKVNDQEEYNVQMKSKSYRIIGRSFKALLSIVGDHHQRSITKSI